MNKVSSYKVKECSEAEKIEKESRDINKYLHHIAK